MSFQTEFPFTLPKGYLDEHGHLHREGVMRLATARDEIEPLRDYRVHSSRGGYLILLLLSRVCLYIGRVKDINPDFLLGLPVADLGYLQTLYRLVNETGATMISIQCPECNCRFDVDIGRRKYAQREIDLG